MLLSSSISASKAPETQMQVLLLTVKATGRMTPVSSSMVMVAKDMLRVLFWFVKMTEEML